MKSSKIFKAAEKQKLMANQSSKDEFDFDFELDDCGLDSLD
jgi:hypothetical protein